VCGEDVGQDGSSEDAIVARGRPSLEVPGTIAGTVTLTEWHCGGAPPLNDVPIVHGDCTTTGPYAATIAIAKPGEHPSDGPRLVAYVTSNADGSFEASVPPGLYTLTTKYGITHDREDWDGLISGWVAPFEVKSGASVRQNFALSTPPPP
jgi:hypothetical protein